MIADHRDGCAGKRGRVAAEKAIDAHLSQAPEALRLSNSDPRSRAAPIQVP